jgi:HEAT repeat protein
MRNAGAVFTLRWLWLAGVAMALAVPLCGRAQAQTSDDREGFIATDELKTDEKVRVQKIQLGTVSMADSDKRVLEKAAKWYIYRLTWPQFQDRIPPEGQPLSSALSVNNLLQDLFGLLLLPDAKRSTQLSASQERYMQEFTAALIPPIEKVLQNSKPIARVNAAIALARLGETGNEAVVKPLLKILNDKDQLDAVKLWALVGMKNVFRAKDVPGAEPFKDRDDAADYIHDMLVFLGRKPSLPANAPPEEMEAFKYVRCEAIRAVGQTRWPLVEKKKEKLGRPALELLRIMRKDGISPVPTFSEQIEAAIGICLMRPRLYPNYQVQYALQHLGQFLLDFADKYEEDRKKPVKSEAWKWESFRLQQALSVLEEVEAPEADKKQARSFVAEARKVLKHIQDNEESGASELRKWLDKNTPPENSLYKGEKDATIKTETSE